MRVDRSEQWSAIAACSGMRCRRSVEAGGLIGEGPPIPAHDRRAATDVDKILNGTEPADLPVEQPTTCELVIHLKTAKELGLTIPPTLLFQADEVLR